MLPNRKRTKRHHLLTKVEARVRYRNRKRTATSRPRSLIFPHRNRDNIQTVVLSVENMISVVD